MRAVRRCYSKMSQCITGLAYIDIKDVYNGPFDLFKEWQQEANKFNVFTAIMNIATATKDGTVSNRNVVMRELVDNGIIFCTPGRGKKTKNLIENSSVSACFMWSYKKDGKSINRQIRMEGIAEKLSCDETKRYFDSEPLFGKIRANICVQGEPADWDDLKTRHDDFVKDVVEKGVEIKMPEDYTGFKVVPTTVDFYYAHDNYIADRILFTKEEDKWKHKRICA